jgi:hypothetical protein
MSPNSDQSANLIKQAKLIIPRLEKITPDSSWAHRASGCRGTLIRLVTDNEDNAADTVLLWQALNQSYYLLEQAAKERVKG